MYKIMLADDEGIVIDSLKFIIEKEFKDTCEVQYAKTGRSVIELAESFRRTLRSWISRCRESTASML